MIKICDFSLKKGNFVLKNIQLDVHKEEIFAILGKTGSGKTLLLEAIAGLYPNYQGRIDVNGSNISNIPPEKRNIGFVHQDCSLFPHMSVYNNIKYGLKMHKVDKKDANRRIQELVDILGISHILDQYPKTLSGGEAQRVALARTLVLQPDLLLMDEPFSALDPNTRQSMYDMIFKLKEKYKVTILCVTHNFEEAQIMAQRIGIMIDGELKGISYADQLYRRYDDKDVEEFLGGN